MGKVLIMEISALDIRCCRYDGAEITGAAMRDGQAIMGLEFLVYTLRTTSGQSASMFGFAGRSSLVIGICG